MPRAPRRRSWTEPACFHLLNRGHARETILHDHTDRDYCLMGNHFHLVFQLADARRLSALMAGLLVAYWHHYRRRYALVGHLFQGRFKSPANEAETYLLSCGRYVERNPVNTIDPLKN